jgi:hypothetical protein
MFEKLKLFWSLFHQGAACANPAAWKTHQISANQIAAVVTTLVGISAAFGYQVDVNGQTALAIGGGLVAVVNVVLTIISSKTVGLPTKSEGDAIHETAGAIVTGIERDPGVPAGVPKTDAEADQILQSIREANGTSGTRDKTYIN